MRTWRMWTLAAISCCGACLAGSNLGAEELRVAAAAVELKADDAMVIGGGIQAGKLTGQEGQLRAVAVVLQLGAEKAAIVACDVLMLNRDILDPVTEEISAACGIPPDRLLINATHTHHAPTTVTIHGYQRDMTFCHRVQEAIVQAVSQANDALTGAGPAGLHFALGEETTFGQNSRLLLSDGTIYWIGPYDDAVRPTGPFDPQLPVLAFKEADRLKAVIFNHSTHTIGARKAARSPSIYGLTAQELESELGGFFCFLEGASGSTHNLKLKADEAIANMKQAVRDTLDKAQPVAVDRLAGARRSFKFKVRTFDEAQEDTTVSTYCRKRAPDFADGIVEVFRRQRAVLAPQQGEERETWIQVVAIGDVAIVGVPAEFFTQLGVNIKERSPFPHTVVAELANDYVGYLPDEEGHRLGGYQTWAGLHSFAEPGTGERMVDEAVKILEELHAGSM